MASWRQRLLSKVVAKFNEKALPAIESLHDSVKIDSKDVYKIFFYSGVCATTTSILYLMAKQYQSFVIDLSEVRLVVDTEKKSDEYIYLQNVDMPIDAQLDGRRLPKLGDVWQWITPWRYTRRLDPITLIRFSNSDSLSTRELAYHELSVFRGWSEPDLCVITQGLGYRLRSALARTLHTDVRFFMPQNHSYTCTEPVEPQMRRVLNTLPLEHVDRCTYYFTHLALQKGASDKKAGGEDFINHWLDSVRRHTLLPPQSVSLVSLGVLPVLQYIYENQGHNLNILRSVARIIANLSQEKSVQQDIAYSGWVSILYSWLHNPDLALFLYAAKALANLDVDQEEVHDVFADGIYLYHPWYRVNETMKADVVFVHGLLGGPFRTWRQRDPPSPPLSRQHLQRLHEWAENHDTERMAQFYQSVAYGDDLGVCIEAITIAKPGMVAKHAKMRQDQLDGNKSKKKTKRQRCVLRPDDYKTTDKFLSRAYTFCWPKDWLAHDCPNTRLLTVEYDTQLSEWAHECPYDNDRRTIEMRSIELLQKLAAAGVGKRPIIWVGHSMGGLLIKQMLHECRNQPGYEHILRNTRGLIFYSVPHLGSPLAAYGHKISFPFFPSTEVRELKQNSNVLLKLHENFRNLMFDEGIPLLSFGEGDQTQLHFNVKILIVPEESSDPGFGEYYRMENCNHLNICKPENRFSQLYLLTLSFILDCLPELNTPKILENIQQTEKGVIVVNPEYDPSKFWCKEEATVIRKRSQSDPSAFVNKAVVPIPFEIVEQNIDEEVYDYMSENIY